MNGFKTLEINNFRGIDHLMIDDFSRVNVLLGQNNSGKSTVLEAIAMLMGMSNPDLPQAINAVRARKPFSKYTYEGLSGACENDIEIRSIVM